MDVFRIVGGKRLTGTARIRAAKNAVLPILAAAILTDEAVILEDCPEITDVGNMLSILSTLGVKYSREGARITVDASLASGWEMPTELSKSLRSSIFMLGPILGRFRKATVTYPGGCEIGLRPIDMHLSGLRSLGVDIREAHGMIYCDGANMRGGQVCLDFPSVGATENVMMAAATAHGESVIHNAAREPEIVDLQRFMNLMGADIRGAGTDRIVIKGVRRLSGARFTPLPDRIVAGTLMVAAAMTGGSVRLQNARAGDLASVMGKLFSADCEISPGEGYIDIEAPKRLRAIEVSTQPYPGFPTDMQAQFMAMCAVAEGASVIVENVFENRFAHASQLRCMGADIVLSSRAAMIRGGRLTGARVQARDLRGGAALTLAGLAAEGVTEVEGVELIDRGYEKLEETLNLLGADVRRV